MNEFLSHSTIRMKGGITRTQLFFMEENTENVLKRFKQILGVKK